MIRFLAAIILCAIGGLITAEVVISPAGRWVLASIAGVFISFFSSIYICKKLGVN